MKIAVITGATSGMGRDMVEYIISQKYSVDEIWLLGRRKERLEECKNRHKEIDFRLFPLDITDKEEIEEFHATLKELHPEIKLFVHAAGIGIMGQIEEIPVEEQEETVRINVEACVGMTGRVLPYMKTGGQMILFASSAAFLPQPGFAVYAASKAFVLSYVRALRAESRHRKLRITAVCPGAVKTEFFDRAAKNKTIPAYKKLVMADPAKVVRKAWKDNLRGKEISIYGLPMKGFCLAAKVLPHSLFLAFMGTKDKKDKKK